MTRPSQDRTRVEVWVKRSSLAWLTEQAAAEGKPRSALVRDLLAEAIAARQGTTPRSARHLVTADTPGPKPQTSACRRCDCAGYDKGARNLWCVCGHGIGDHR